MIAPKHSHLERIIGPPPKTPERFSARDDMFIKEMNNNINEMLNKTQISVLASFLLNLSEIITEIGIVISIKFKNFIKPYSLKS